MQKNSHFYTGLHPGESILGLATESATRESTGSTLTVEEGRGESFLKDGWIDSQAEQNTQENILATSLGK